MIFAAAAMLGSSRVHGQQTPAANAQQPPAITVPKTPAATPKKTPAAAAGQSSAKKTAAPLALKTQKDKVSYAIGMSEGNRLEQGIKQGEVDIDSAILLRAIKDSLAGAKLLLTDQEAQAALNALQADLRKKQEVKAQQLAEANKQLGEANKREGEAFFDANRAKEGVVTMPSGLQYKILEEGTGPKPTSNDMVTVNYRGTLLNGTEFDSSYKHGQPFTTNVSSQIIKGWTEALQLMPVGSKWQLFIPPDLAYGPPGRPPAIGPNSALVFEVELLSIQPRPTSPAMPAPPQAPAAPPATKP